MFDCIGGNRSVEIRLILTLNVPLYGTWLYTALFTIFQIFINYTTKVRFQLAYRVALIESKDFTPITFPYKQLSALNIPLFRYNSYRIIGCS